MNKFTYPSFSFTKYEGTGNDFVLIDDRNGSFPAEDAGFIQLLCDRRLGIGADGLMLLRSHPSLDFEMLYFNADGYPGSMCGNGGRCIVAFAHTLSVFQGSETRFMAPDGIHFASVLQDSIALQMLEPKDFTSYPEGPYLHTGSPHQIVFVENAQEVEVASLGATLRHHPRFEKGGGTNVNFVEKKGEDFLFVRTFERGVEAETYSCGTGVTASAIAAFPEKEGAVNIRIQTLGGDLKVRYIREKGTVKDVWLIGPAKAVFQGIWLKN